MSNIDTSEPAFPTHRGLTQGMTLRQYYAAKAMQALLSSADWREDMSFKDTAVAAFKQADEMLAAEQ
jgi:uncharacterized protein YbbC (DUF1343 family)